MFCSKCGKKIDDNARFCSGCGVEINKDMNTVVKTGINPNVESISTFIEQKGIKIICLFLMIGVTIFVAFGGVVPILSGGIELFDYSLNEEWTLFELLDLASYLEKYIAEVSIFKVVIYLAIGCYIISVIAAGKAVINLLSKGKNEDITSPITVSMVIGETAYIIVFILKSLINYITAEELYGMEFLTTTKVGWVLLILPIVNLFVFKKGYLGAAYYDDEARITKDKVCAKCKTIYVIGNKCPKCGSQNVE